MFLTHIRFYSSLTLALFIAASVAAQPVPDAPPPIPTDVPELTVPERASGIIANDGATISPDNETIFSVLLERFTLTDGLIAYSNGEEIYVPLGELFAILELAITVDKSGNGANGWFISEDQTFVLDVAANRLQVKDQILPLQPGDVVPFEGDIYARLSAFNTWLPIKLEANTFDLSLSVKSAQKLPAQARAEREERRQSAQRGEQVDINYPRVQTPYMLASRPFVDIQASSTFTRTDGNGEVQNTYSFQGTSDLLYMDADYLLSGTTRQGLDQARLRLSRTDPDGQLLGPLGATNIEIGDVTSYTIPLTARAVQGRGAKVTNIPDSRPTEFDSTRIEGDAPIGWEVELYRNDALIDFKKVDSDGKYRFENVALQFGKNEFRIVQYGPQGQKREEVQNFTIGPDQIEPGVGRYEVSVVQDGETLFNLGSTTAGFDSPGRERVTGRYVYGINKYLSLGASAASVYWQDERRFYGSVDATASLFGTLAKLQFVNDDEGNYGAEAAIQGELFNDIRWTTKYARFWDYEAEPLGEGTAALTDRASARVDYTLRVADWSFPLSFGTDYEEQKDGEKTTRYTQRISTNRFGISVSNDLDFERTNNNGNVDWEGDGTLRTNYRLDDITLRAEAAYNLINQWDAESLNLSADWDIDEDYTVTGRATRNFNAGTLSTLGASINRKFTDFTLGLNGQVNDDGDYTVGMNLTTAIGYSDTADEYITSPDRWSDQGKVIGRVFLDENLNGVIDDDDTPLEDVQLEINGSRKPQKTNANGAVAMVSGSSRERINVTVSQGTLTDPFWASTQPGYSVLARPGVETNLDFPIVRTGEIEGTLYLAIADGTQRELSRVPLELVNADGRIVNETDSQFDGYYLFTPVLPGNYTLRVKPEFATSNNLSGVLAKPVAISGKGDSLSGIDFLISEPANEADAATPAAAPAATAEEPPLPDDIDAQP